MESTQRLKAYTLLNRTAAVMEADLRKVLAPFGLNCNEYAILEFLSRHGDQTIHQIGKEIGVTSGSMTYLIDKLEKNGYIRRQSWSEDRRVLYVIITAGGRELMGKAIPAYHAKVGELLACWTEEETRKTIRLLGKARSNMQVS